jgi:peptide/nickel transport system permease protein
MKRYILVRLFEAAIAVWGIATIVFFVTRLGGDPALLLLPTGASEAQLTELRAALGLDKPLLTQYVHFLRGVATGDFGQSFQQMRPALDVVLERLPATALLASAALVVGVLLGGVTGFVAARYRGTMFEFIAMLLALLGQATPVFWLGLMLIMLFAVDLGWLPTGGYGGWANLVLPTLTLATFTSASITRLLRSRMVEILQDDYVRTAWAKGLKPRIVYMRHVMRNALIPVVTMVGILAGELLGGSVITETIFAWPGVGRAIIQAVQANDFPVVQAGVTLIACIYVAINLVVDLTYGMLDPRIRIAR